MNKLIDQYTAEKQEIKEKIKEYQKENRRLSGLIEQIKYYYRQKDKKNQI